MAGENIEEFGPFGRASGVGHVAGDQDQVQRPGGVLGLEAGHDPSHALVAARPAPPALDAKAIALADDMDVGKMRHPPDAAARRRVERVEVERLVHARVGEAPDERGRREVSRHDDDSVGERGPDQMMRDREIRGRSDPPRRRPDEGSDDASDGGEQDSGAGAAHRPHTRKLRSPVWPEGSFREMADRLAAQGVSGLNRERIERPEIRLRDAKQRAPAEPPCGDDSEKHKRGANSVVQGLGQRRPDPCGRDERREA